MYSRRQIQFLHYYTLRSTVYARSKIVSGPRSFFTRQSLDASLQFYSRIQQRGTAKGRCNSATRSRAGSMSEKTVDHQQVKVDWAKRGFSFGVFVDPPGQVWADFTHKTDELVMLTKGEYELTFNGKSFRPSIGEEVLIPAKALHTVENTGGNTNEWLYGYKNR